MGEQAKGEREEGADNNMKAGLTRSGHRCRRRWRTGVGICVARGDQAPELEGRGECDRRNRGQVPGEGEGAVWDAAA